MQLSQLDFVKNYNNKLLCFNFIIVEPKSFLTNGDLKYDEGEKYKISINKNHFCFAEIVMCKKMTFEMLILAGYNLLDVGLNKKEYYEYLYNHTNLKKTNHQLNIFSVVWFKKITQLSLLDNNEIYES